MAVTQILTSDTLEQLRVKINALAQNDFGDPALLGPAGIAATSVVGAVIELSDAVLAAAGFTIEDVTSTIQQVLPGERLRVLGSSNQINAVVSVPDTLTVSLTPNVTISGNFTATSGNITAGGSLHTLGTVEINGNTIRSTDSNTITISDNITLTSGNITAGGSLHTLGTVEINGNTIRSTDSSRININDTFRATAFETSTGLSVLDEFTGAGVFPRITSTRADKIFIFDVLPLFNTSIAFEGSSADDFETTVSVVNPTDDRFITFPDITGTVITSGDTGTVTNTMLAGSITTAKILDDAITEAKIADDAVGINQLKSVVTLQILNSSGGILKTLYGAGA
jgi:hypothetical protein